MAFLYNPIRCAAVCAVSSPTTWTPPDDLARFPNLELLFSVSAGVDRLHLGSIPAGLPVVRMIEPGPVAGMVVRDRGGACTSSWLARLPRSQRAGV